MKTVPTKPRLDFARVRVHRRRGEPGPGTVVANRFEVRRQARPRFKFSR
jgi:hypothetical protein